MTVSCPECRSVFRVDPAKVPATGVRAPCSVCGGVMSVAPAAGPTAAGSAGAAAGDAGVMPATPRSLGALATPVARAVPAAGTPPLAGVPVPPTVPGGGDMTPARAPSVATPSVATPSVATPVGGAPVAAAPVAAAPAGATPAGGTPRRPINPFLNADPGQRARRLARALVSDLVAYHPQKREEGLRNGTLRQLFRDEIKKSYEEYVEQVGRDLAESTGHFRDALNDILAEGRKLF
jgi:predicted Zn finger-like uncharacterized protein